MARKVIEVNKNCKLVIDYDRVSKYYTCEGNIMQFDENYILYQVDNLKKVKKKGIVIIKLFAISAAEVKRAIKYDRLWIERNAPKNNHASRNILFSQLTPQH